MRLLVGLFLIVASTTARAQDHVQEQPAAASQSPLLIAPPNDDALAAAKGLRIGGITVLVAGVAATIIGSVLAGDAISWGIGNGLGEHYDPTPAWVPTYETAGWVLVGGGQAAIISGIAMLAVGDARRDRARAHVSLSLAPTPTGASAGLTVRF